MDPMMGANAGMGDAGGPYYGAAQQSADPQADRRKQLMRMMAMQMIGNQGQQGGIAGGIAPILQALVMRQGGGGLGGM